MNWNLVGFLVCGGLLLFFVQLASHPEWIQIPGFRSQGPSTHGESRWARRWERKQLGRPTRPGRMAGDGVVLGFFGGLLLQTPAEDNALVFGVQRSGKTSTVAVPTLLGWQGAAITTSIKHELVELSARHRRQQAPVYVLAPLDEGTDWEAFGATPVSWNPLTDVEMSHHAVELADLLTADGKQGQSAHWYHSASSLLAGLVLHEQPKGGDLRSVLGLLNTKTLTDYQGMILSTPDPIGGELLTAFSHTPEREAGSIASTARSCLSLWMDARVAAATAARAAQPLDLDRLLMENATLYLVAPAEEAIRLRPLFSALIQSLLRKATARARRSGGVLPTRLLFALDEVANFAQIPRLGTHISTGPGQGINWLLCFHDLAQLEQGYGEEQARTIWNNCRARLLLPGQGDLKTLEHFSRVIGDETRAFELHASSPGGSSRSEQRIGKPLCPPDLLRRLKEPLLLYANAPPARLRARRWDQVPEWRRLIRPEAA